MAGVRWTLADVEKLQARKTPVSSPSKDTVQGNTKERAVKSKVAIPKADPKGLASMKATLKMLNIPFVTELRVSESRKFRFDIAIPEMKIAMEYEGIFSDVSRHTSLKGYSRDVEKYNLAATEGWRVLRYTALNYNTFANDITKLIELK